MGRIRWVLALMALSLPVEAIAQQPGPLFREPYRKWDIGGGAALRFSQQADAVVPGGAWTGEFGRYWTSHIKTSVAVTTAGQSTSTSAFTAQSWTTRRTTTVPAGLGASATWQFLDNEFVHPYVTAGARFASTSTLTKVYSNGLGYPLVLEDNSPNRIQVRGLIGGGFKSYFGDGRTFMRSELLVAIDPSGTAHAVLQLGVGVDF
jgi:hypothetical protein